MTYSRIVDLQTQLSQEREQRDKLLSTNVDLEWQLAATERQRDDLLAACNRWLDADEHASALRDEFKAWDFDSLEYNDLDDAHVEHVRTQLIPATQELRTAIARARSSGSGGDKE